jgi:hypothetical protein
MLLLQPISESRGVRLTDGSRYGSLKPLGIAKSPHRFNVMGLMGFARRGSPKNKKSRPQGMILQTNRTVVRSIHWRAIDRAITLVGIIDFS